MRASLLLAILAALLVPATPEAAACALPADPYVVVKISKKPLDQIASPDDFIKTDQLPVNDPLTGAPFRLCKINEDEELHFITLWDLTQGGTKADPLQGLDAATKLAVIGMMSKYSEDDEMLVPVKIYFQWISSGKVSFKLAEMIPRQGGDWTDPLQVVNIGGFVKDGDYALNGGSDAYGWNDGDELKRDNAVFPNTFTSPRFPRVAAHNNGTNMDRQGPRGANTVYRVTDARWRPQGTWEMVADAYSTSYDMDANNIAANIGNEKPDSLSSEAKSGDYAFTYHVPSDPLAYQVIVRSALVFELKNVVWEYTEKVFEWKEDLIRTNSDGTTATYSDWVEQPDDPITNTIEVKGRLARSTQDVGQSAEVRVGSLLVAVQDRTPPVHSHVMLQPLKGTTGEKLSDPAASSLGNPAKVPIEIIDNNPFLGRDETGVLFDKANLGVDVYYAVQMYDYGAWTPGLLPVDLDVRPKTVWAKASGAGIVPVVTAHKSDGAQVTLASPVKNTDAVFSVARFELPIEAFEEPMGWHYATTSWNWENGRKLKFFAVARDGSGNATPADAKLPLLASASGVDAPNEPVADSNPDSAAQPVLDKDQVVVSTSPGMPDFNYSAAHASCPKGQLGVYGYIEVYDNDRPIVYLRVTDTKFNKKTLFGNLVAGDARRQACREGKTTNSNKDTVDLAQKPYADDTDLWEFSAVYGGETDGYQKQLEDLLATPPIFKPAEYALSGTAGPMYGYWVDEDTPLVFECFARDNINFDKEDEPWAWGIKTTELKPTEGRETGPQKKELNPPDTLKVIDAPSSGTTEVSPPPWPQIIFRNPNKPSGEHDGECSIYLEVRDDARPEGGGQKSRKLKVNFHVMDNRLKIQSLEETRVRSATDTGS